MRAHVSQTLSYITMLLSRTLIISVLLVVVKAQFEPFPRNVVKTLSVDNGAEAGTWRREEFCPTGTYATGFKQKYEPPLTLDDSGINAIQLVCEPLDKTDDRFYGTSDSHGGPWGEWQTTLMCTSPSPDFRFVATGFLLRVEPTGLFGHKGVVNSAIWCADINNQEQGFSLEGIGGDEGDWGTWSENCGAGAAVCGIAVKFEVPNYTDETAVTDAIMYCCDD